MKLETPKRIKSQSVAIILASLSSAMAFLAFVCWLTGRWEWLSLGRNYVPIAPSTALLMVLLNTTLLSELFLPENPTVRRSCQGVALLAIISGSLALLRPFWGWSSPFEEWLAGTTKTLGQLPLGQMSPLTGLVFLLSGFVFLSESLPVLNQRLWSWGRFGSNLLIFWISAVVLFGYVAGTPVFSEGLIIPMAFWTSIVFIFSSIAMALKDLVKENATFSVTFSSKQSPTQNRLWILIFSLAALVIIAGGFVYYRSEAVRIQKEKSGELAAIGKIKVEQILLWRKERAAGIARFARSPAVRLLFMEWLRRPADDELRDFLLERLKLEVELGFYFQALLSDADQHILLSFPETVEMETESCDAIQKAWDSLRPVSSELHFSASGKIHEETAMALRDGAGRPLAVLMLIANPQESLFPMIQTWPTSSRSAETLLVQLEGDKVLFLNDLKHRKGSALTLRIPLSQTTLPAAQAISGKTGAFMGKDYRGVDVLADLRPVPGTSWFLVSKEDTSEILREVRYRAFIVFVVVAILLLSVAGLMSFLYKLRLLEDRKRAEEAVRRADERYRELVEGTEDLITIVDRQGHLTYVNHTAEKIFGVRPEDCIGRSAFDFIHPDDRERTKEAFEGWVRDKKERVIYQNRQVNRSGRVFEMLWNINLHFSDSGELIEMSNFARDITEIKKAEEELSASKRKLDLALRGARMGVWQFNLVENKRIFDHQVCALLGIDPTIFGGTAKEFFAVVHPEDQGKVKEALARTIDSGASYEPEYRVVWFDGSIHHIAGRGELIRDEQGKPQAINGVIWDITERKKAEEALMKSEEKFRSIIVVSPVPMALNNEEKKITFLNPAFIQTFGYTREDIPTLADWWPKAYPDPQYRQWVADTWQSELEEAKRTGTAFPPMELIVRCKDGTSKTVLANASSIFNSFEGDHLVVLYDITERKKAEEAVVEQSKIFEAFFENTITSLVFLDKNFNFIRVNKAYAKACQRDVSEFLGHNHFEFYPSDIKPIFERVVETKESFQAIARPFVFPDHPEWGVTYWDWILTPILNNKGEVEYLVFSLNNVTDRKRSEEEIKKLNVELEERVKQRTAELSTAVKELEAFGYSVAHDLKAPLRAMSGFASILSDDYAPKLDENGRRVIGVINDNAKTMGQLIDDLLKLSHFGRKAMDLADIDVTKFVQSIWHELKEVLVSDRIIEMSIKPGMPPARVDLLLARQIFINLISNAIKFTARKERAVIEVGGYEKDGERVYYVKDNGAGFDMKYENKLFGVFQRLHSQGQFGGTGIGLAIVHSAVRRHGGRVWAEGEVGQGATFYFTLSK